jgi:hypothetical protein
MSLNKNCDGICSDLCSCLCSCGVCLICDVRIRDYINPNIIVNAANANEIRFPLAIIGHNISPDSKKVNMLSGNVMDGAMGDEKMHSIKGV